MQVGCGVYEHAVRSRPYLYFWHYESRGGRRIQVKEYVGPVRSPRTQEDARRRCEAYYARAVHELEQMRRSTIASITGSS